jgi:hypothetical protein
MANSELTLGEWLPSAERYWAKVYKRDPSGCWLWIGAKHVEGYGLMVRRINGVARQIRATHIALALDGRSVPAGLCALHTCDRTACVNPAHLYVGTPADNARDRDSRGRTAPMAGSLNPRGRLTAEDVRTMREAYAAGTGPTELSRRYGVRPAYVAEVLKGRRWQTAGGPIAPTRGHGKKRSSEELRALRR